VRASAEQLAVVRAPLGPAVVVAGAGSGKTETMANRVVELVAAGTVAGERVLGLTFTRKAAAELADRIRGKLRERGLGGGSEPTVSTYDAFAARIVADHAMRVGREPRVAVLRLAAAFAIAAAVVDGYEGEVVAGSGDWPSRATLVGAVCQLHERLAVHRRTPDELAAFSDAQLAALLSIGASPKTGAPLARVRELVARERPRRVLAELVVRYRAVLDARGLLDFASVAALAAELAAQDAVRAAERATAEVVLLDEFQDTSPVQLDLLAGLFDGAAVTAVGDPNQAIFGWRGAGSDTMGDFRARFGRQCLELHLSTTYRNPEPVLAVANALAAPLRDSAARIEVRQLVAAVPGAGAAAADAPVPVTCSRFATEPAEARAVAAAAADALDAGRSVAVLVRTRRQIPELLARLREAGVPVTVVGLSGLLGVPAVVEVVSVLQVLADADAGAALMRLLCGSRWRIGARDLRALQRSARTLAASTVPRSFPDGPRHDPRRSAEIDAAAAAVAGPVARPDPAGIVDALDALVDVGRVIRDPPAPAGRLPSGGSPSGRRPSGSPPSGGSPSVRPASGGPPGRAARTTGPAGMSAEGLARLQRLGAELRSLRRRLDQPLADLVVDVVTTTGIDVELAAAAGGTAGQQADLDSFVAEADAFAAAAGSAAFTPSGRATATGLGRRLSDTARSAVSLAGFLAFLEVAADTERGLERDETAFDLGDGAGTRGVVDLLTVHAAKGLEWDVVFVPGMSAGMFPTKARNGNGWLFDLGELPGPLRRDSSGQPVLGDLEGLSSDAAKDVLDDFARQVGAAHLEEERRLAYVAVTRARVRLWCSGHAWSPELKNPRGSSVLLDEIEALAARHPLTSGVASPVRVGVWEVPGDDPRSTGDPDFASRALLWPLDPLGPDRRAEVEIGAALVRKARDRLRSSTAPDGVSPPRPADGAPGEPSRIGSPDGVTGVERWHGSPIAAREPESRAADPAPGSPALDPGAGLAELDPGHGSPELDPGPKLAELDPELARWTADTAALCAARPVAGDPGEVEVELPSTLSVSDLVALARDPSALAGRIRRPMPQPPRPAAELGSAFHEWLERRWRQEELIDLDDLPGASDTELAVVDEAGLVELQEAFAASEWASRTPRHQEYPFLMPLGPLVLRGRIDAVFTDDPAGGVDVVDWKTGRAPTGESELAAVAVQLAAYRLAWHRLQGVPVDRIRAGFHYVAAGRTVRPADLLDADGLTALVTRPARR